MPDLQRYPWNLHLIKNVKYTVVFLTWKVFISDNFPLLFINNKNASQLVIEPANENKQFKETKTLILYLIHTWSDKALKLGIVIYAWRVTLTVPLRVNLSKFQISLSLPHLPLLGRSAFDQAAWQAVALALSIGLGTIFGVIGGLVGCFLDRLGGHGMPREAWYDSTCFLETSGFNLSPVLRSNTEDE